MKSKMYIFLSMLMLGARVEAKTSELLRIRLEPAGQTAVIGSTVTFSGSLTNLSASTIFVNGDRWTGDLPVNDAVFKQKGPKSISAGLSWTGELFHIYLDPAKFRDAIDKPLFGSYLVLGGSSAGSHGKLQSQNFVVRISSTSPQ